MPVLPAGKVRTPFLKLTPFSGRIKFFDLKNWTPVCARLFRLWLQLYIFAITERQRAINIKTMALPFNTLSLEQGWEVAEWKMQPQRWREAERMINYSGLLE